MKWFQQLVHHDIWDYDIAAAPALIEVRRNGKVIPAVAQQTKMALLFIFNRETGEPIFGLEERPVPQTTRAGRMDVADAAVPGQAGAARAQLDEAVGAGEGHAAARGLLPGPVGQGTSCPMPCPISPGSWDRTSWCSPARRAEATGTASAFNKPLGLIITNVMTAGQWGHLEAGGRGGRWPWRTAC